MRTRLHAQLLPAPGARLTTVVAPAGWDKTTLLAAWAHDPAESRPVGWLSIDAADDEPVRFWTQALAALSAVAPDVTREAAAALGAPGLDPVGVALAALLNALTSCAEQYVLPVRHALTEAVRSCTARRSGAPPAPGVPMSASTTNPASVRVLQKAGSEVWPVDPGPGTARYRSTARR